ncbi:MAG: hypothetical protein ISS25_04790 [Nanoarchaeota archaeon]|nr:hypothetical protein [DPANN group archaeon]MBL7117117.1 hypothetical protein [Nanoarchaeota archaeon]
MDRKGFQIAVNFLVVIILSLVLFGAGMVIFTKIIDKGTDFQAKITDRMQEQLNAAMDDGSVIVVQPQRVNGKRGKSVLFTVGFWNEFPNEYNFKVVVSDKDGLSGAMNYFTDPYPDTQPNQRQHALISIDIPKNSVSGQYAFDVEVQYKGDATNPPANWERYDKPKRIYVVVP